MECDRVKEKKREWSEINRVERAEL